MSRSSPRRPTARRRDGARTTARPVGNLFGRHREKHPPRTCRIHGHGVCRGNRRTILRARQMTSVILPSRATSLPTSRRQKSQQSRSTPCSRPKTSPSGPAKKTRWRQETAGRGNRRATHGRSRCERCIPRVRGGLVPGQDGSNVVVSAGLTLNEVRYLAIQPRTRLGFIPKRVPATSLGARTIPTASAQPSEKRLWRFDAGGGERRRFDWRKQGLRKSRARSLIALGVGKCFVLRLLRELVAHPYTKLKLRARTSSPLGW